MRKLILLSVLSFGTLAIMLATYLYWANSTFVYHEIQRRAASGQIRLLDQVHSAHQWYGRAEINQQTGKQLLVRYDWKHGFEKKIALAGRIVSDRPSDCSTCFYRIEVKPHDRRYHPYNYSLYVLSADLKMFEVYEVFED